MEAKKIILIARILNTVEIVVTAGLYILFKFLNIAAGNVTTLEEVDRYTAIQNFGLVAAGVISVAVIVLTIVLMVQNHNRVKGLTLLLLAGVVTLAFSILGMMLGIIIWLLCGASLKQLTQREAEDDFEAKLQSEQVVSEVNSNTVSEDTKQL